MPFYQHHVFFCTNVKADGKKCCSEKGSDKAASMLKSQLLDAQAFGPGKIRVSTTGCLGRCQKGPCIAVYPEGRWYTFESEADVQTFGECLLSGDLSSYNKEID